jgi:hypothetical protein
MRKAIIAAVLILVIAASVAYYQFLYPPTLFKHKVQHALDDFSTTVSTKDQSKIKQALNLLLSDSSKVQLEVSFYNLSQPTGSPLLAQDFDKLSFLTFVDNIVYSLDAYGMTPHIQICDLDKEHKTAKIMFTSSEWAEGKSYYGGISMNTRFSTETTCTSDVTFNSTFVIVDSLTCKMKLLSLPKDGEEKKMIRMVE